MANAKKPVRLQILSGNPGHRLPPNDRPVELESAAPECPEWLEDRAKEEWTRVTAELLAAGLLTRADRAALAGYCQAWARWQQAEELIADNGMTFETDKGYVGTRPEVLIAQRSLAIVMQFAKEFGLTPASRGKMALPMAQDNEDASDLD